MQTLYNELQTKIATYKIDRFDTIFFGGGTPSALHPKFYIPIFTLLKRYITDTTEITFEANPNSATKDWLLAIKAFGATRISFGVQSFDDAKLLYLGRAHNGKKAIQAIELAQSVGFDSINCDILYNTSLDTHALIANDINTMQQLAINHISAYSLTIEENTHFFDIKTTETSDEVFSQYCIDTIIQAGFKQYEISNFATHEVFFSKHNLGYWQKKEYIGAGAGAFGCIDNKRYCNAKNLDQYIKTQHCETEYLKNDEITLETIFLGLRSIVGVSKKILNTQQYKNALFLTNEGKLRFENDTFYNDNFLICDEIALFLTRD